MTEHWNINPPKLLGSLFSKVNLKVSTACNSLNFERIMLQYATEGETALPSTVSLAIQFKWCGWALIIVLNLFCSNKGNIPFKYATFFLDGLKHTWISFSGKLVESLSMKARPYQPLKLQYRAWDCAFCICRYYQIHLYILLRKRITKLNPKSIHNQYILEIGFGLT